MRRLSLSLIGLTLLCLAAGARAGELCDRSLGADLRCARCGTTPCCCPDDYCRKPLPCVPCLKACPLPDDYCRKPLPSVPCVSTKWCPDDYCRKPFPNFCWPTNWQFYRCPPAGCGGASGNGPAAVQKQIPAAPAPRIDGQARRPVE